MSPSRRRCCAREVLGDSDDRTCTAWCRPADPNALADRLAPGHSRCAIPSLTTSTFGAVRESPAREAAPANDAGAERREIVGRYGVELKSTEAAHRVDARHVEAYTPSSSERRRRVTASRGSRPGIAVAAARRRSSSWSVCVRVEHDAAHVQIGDRHGIDVVAEPLRFHVL